MAVSPNGRYLALFTADGKLWVVSADLQKNLTEITTKSESSPDQLVWYCIYYYHYYYYFIIILIKYFLTLIYYLSFLIK